MNTLRTLLEQKYASKNTNDFYKEDFFFKLEQLIELFYNNGA